MRYEIKYRIESQTWNEVENVVLFHPAGFSEIYGKRKVHNVYFDTHEMNAFYENTNGVSQRSKLRVRWYEEDGIVSKAQLEVKNKANMLGHKKIVNLDSWQPHDLTTLAGCVKEQLKGGISLNPVFRSSYVRSYYREHSGQFRITIDRELKFWPFENELEIPMQYASDLAVILELKYDREVTNEEVDFITQSIPFPVTKNSKYAHGILLTQNF